MEDPGTLGTTKFISAHDSELACLQLTLDGSMLATASEKGTLIRVYDAAKVGWYRFDPRLTHGGLI